MSKLDSSCTMMMCGGLPVGTQVAVRQGLQAIGDGRIGLHVALRASAETAERPERENLET